MRDRSKLERHSVRSRSRLLPDSSLAGAELSRQKWSSCDRNTVVEQRTIERGGHMPPVTPDFSENILRWMIDHPRG